MYIYVLHGEGGKRGITKYHRPPWTDNRERYLLISSIQALRSVSFNFCHFQKSPQVSASRGVGGKKGDIFADLRVRGGKGAARGRVAIPGVPLLATIASTITGALRLTFYLIHTHTRAGDRIPGVV